MNKQKPSGAANPRRKENDMRRRNPIETMFPEKRCKQCGKIFCITSPEWVYKLSPQSKHPKWFCSWNCLCAYRRELDDKRKKRYAERTGENE